MTPPTTAEIKAFRLSMGGWSQAVLAKALGASADTVADWEIGRHRPPAMLRLAMAALHEGLAPWTATT
jgi:DNA-binding transcriptional regulator YiaG